ncbi:MAG: NADH-quinone oxidoreductase subunit L [Acidobacteriota bacterium]|nr:NADH-quinone oxidoreductase subunit L [Acidobacteriota bacterium]
MDASWLIPLAPGLSAFLLIIFGRSLSRRLVTWLACGSVAVAFSFSLLSALRLRAAAGSVPYPARILLSWIRAGDFRADISFRFDPLAAVMVLVVTGVGLLIHVYSTGYMAREKGYARYFAALNLFTFSMLILVLASNFILMFVGWEGVGLCSYLLIGFWFEKPAAAKAGMKAFLVNRIGDAGFLLGILVLLFAVGSAEFSAVDQAVSGGAIAKSTATLAALLLFAGATGKSAQIPLHVWLPDAMEGPTPVSALIHAATMVTAGVYMVARMNALYAFSGTAAGVVAAVGAFTAVFAATIALVQNDIKRILAYSTISQLGYMFLGCGVGAYAAGIFHLVTHAFFKSLLFLAAGSVMHALSGELDIRRMGGLRHRLPLTYTAFLIGTLAIAGIPLFSGFFSKDAILSAAYAGGHRLLWAAGLLGAVLTAFYMFRLVFLAFHGGERTTPEVRDRIHESPSSMTVPLLILSGLAAMAGWIGIPAVLGEKADLLRRFLAPVIPVIRTPHAGSSSEWFLILTATSAAGLGLGLAWLFYQRWPGLPARFAAWCPGLHKILLKSYGVDEIYQAVLVRPLVGASELTYRRFDLGLIDGAVNGAGAATRFAGRLAASLQTGRIKDYALGFLLGTTIFLAWILL